jgi:hypothetical protein
LPSVSPLRFSQLTSPRWASRAAGGQLASPTNDEFFRFFIQIAFTERERIQCVKELRDILDPQFNQLAMLGISHGIIDNSIKSLRSLADRRLSSQITGRRTLRLLLRGPDTLYGLPVSKNLCLS